MNSLYTLITTVVTIIGLVVLIAMNKVSADVGVPILAGLTSLHIGGNLANVNSDTTPTKSAPAAPKVTPVA